MIGAAQKLADANRHLPGFKPGLPASRGTYLASRTASTGLPYLERVPAIPGQLVGEAEHMGYLPGDAASASSYVGVAETEQGFAYLKRMPVPHVHVDLHSRLPQIIAELPIRLGVELELVTKRIVLGAQHYLLSGGHVISGDLWTSLHNYPVGPESWAVGTDVYYAPYIEYGTSHVPGGYPYLRPATDDVARDLEPLVAGGLTDL